HVDSDSSWIVLLDHSLQRLPLFVAPQLGVALGASAGGSGYRLGGSDRRVHTALTAAAEGNSLDRIAAHGEDVDRSAPRRESRRRHQRGKDGIFVVLPHR